MKDIFRNDKGSLVLEFAVCGFLFIGVVLGLLVLGLWIYNVSQVKQAARIAAYNIAVTGDQAESRHAAMKYLDKTLIACPSANVTVYGSRDKGCATAEAEMHSLFPGFQKLIEPGGKSDINGRIKIRKEAFMVREYRFRPGNRKYFN